MKIIASVLLCLIGVSAAALQETKSVDEQTYQVITHEYVNSLDARVESRCQDGDAVVTGGCYGEERLSLQDQPKRGISLTETNALTSWVCKAKHLRPDQLLKISTRVTCKKPKT